MTCNNRIITVCAFGLLFASTVARAVPVRPQFRNQKWPRNRIDHFVLSNIESQELNPSPQASRYVLVRRVLLDLTGLPPTLEQLNRFLEDKNKNAYESMIDRILSSKAHRDYWLLITNHQRRPTELNDPDKARAWANAVWKLTFGKPLNEDTHQRLLRYLGALAQGKADVKLLRKIVTSATYRQSSEQNPQLAKRDPDNKWLAQRKPTRLPDWVLRRVTLSISQLPNKDGKLVPHHLLKPQPADPNAGLSSTLVLISDTWIQKAAAATARRMLEKGGKTLKERFKYATMLVVQRPPNKQELRTVPKALADLYKRHAKDPAGAKKAAELAAPLPNRVSPVDAAVWTDVSWALFNTKEFIFKP